MSAIIEKLRSNFNSPAEILLFIQLFSFITLLPFMVRFLSIPRLMKIITPRSGENSANFDHKIYRDKVIKFTDYMLSRNIFMFKNTCMKRSLALYCFLRKSGMNIHVCFGVIQKESSSDSRTTADLEGHAWLTHNGDIFLEDHPEVTKKYSMTYCFPEIDDCDKEGNIKYSSQ